MRPLILSPLLVFVSSLAIAFDEVTTQSTPSAEARLEALTAQIEAERKEEQAITEALAAATKQVEAKDLRGAQQTLKSAIEATTSDMFRGRAYDMLRTVAKETGDVDIMTSVYEFQVVYQPTTASRLDEVRSFGKFLREQNALETAVGKYQSRLKDHPDDLAALGLVTWSLIEEKRPRAELLAWNKRFSAANAALSAKAAEEREKMAAESGLAVIYSSAARMWGDAGNAARVQAAVKKTLAGIPPEDSFQERLMRENLGDAYCFVGKFDEGIKQYEAALKAGKFTKVNDWLPDKIRDAKLKRRPQ